MKRRPLILPLAALFFLLAFAAPASAQFGLEEVGVEFLNKDGTPATEAGSHPFAMVTDLSLNTEVVPIVDPNNSKKTIDGEVPEGQLKDLLVEQIPGLVGDQTAIEPCPAPKFAEIVTGGYSACPDESAVGIVAAKAEFEVFPLGTEAFIHSALYMLEPPPGVAARFGFVAATVPISFDVVVSKAPPYNLVVELSNTPQALLIYGSKVTIWGNPSDPTHDTLRGRCLADPIIASAEPSSNGACPVAAGEPLLTLPRSCPGPGQTLFAATAWQGGSDQATATSAAMEDCGTLTFSPQLAAAAPTTASAESPSGLDVDLQVDDPGLTEAGGRAQSDIRSVRLALPEGMTANPAAAGGQGVCTEAQLAAATLQDRGCPGESKLGTVEIETPLLGEPLQGSVYLAEPRKNRFGSLLAAYLVIRSERFGLLVKQAGRIDADPTTGQLTSTFADIPELPFSELRVHFRGGPRAPLATPPRCGTYTATSLMDPWSGGPPATPSSSFAITSGPGGGPCPAGELPFAPKLDAAGTLSPNAGAYSPFYMRLTRTDADQEITRFDALLPAGLVGKIAGVERCSDAALAAAAARSGSEELAAPSCPAGSRIGTVLAGAGVGPELTYVPGTIHLAGPYNGHPLSVAVLTPAVAGPFDLGTVVVREGLSLDPVTAQVEVDGSTAQLPRILEGIPLALRDLRVFLDRENFTLNATSCDPGQVRATLFGTGSDPLFAGEDPVAQLAAHYQAADCGRLGFRPRLSLGLKGDTERGGYPALRAQVRFRAGDANIARAVVRLPHSAFLEQSHIGTICTRVQFAADRCPKGSVYGRARATTPLLDGALEGPVYLRSSNNPLPDLVAALRGPASAPVEVELVGRIDSVNGGIRSTFSQVPDVPVSGFTLSMRGGRKGLIVNSRNLCSSKSRANVSLTAQNAKRIHSRPVVRAAGCKRGRGR